MTTGKDDLTKATQLGSKMGGSPPVAPAGDWPYPGCPSCQPGDGQWHLKELGFSDALRYSGKMDVVDKPNPHEMYGFYLQNHTVHMANGSDITGWQAHRACMGRARAVRLDRIWSLEMISLNARNGGNGLVNGLNHVHGVVSARL